LRCNAIQNLYQTCPSQKVQVRAVFVQLVLVLHHLRPTGQLFSPHLRVTFERKLNYESTLNIATVTPAPRGAAGPATRRPCLAWHRQSACAEKAMLAAATSPAMATVSTFCATCSIA